MIGDTWVAPQIPELALIVQGPDHDLAVLQADPRRAHLRRAFGPQRGHHGDRIGLQELARGVVQGIGHRAGSMGKCRTTATAVR